MTAQQKILDYLRTHPRASLLGAAYKNRLTPAPIHATIKVHSTGDLAPMIQKWRDTDAMGRALDKLLEAFAARDATQGVDGDLMEEAFELAKVALPGRFEAIKDKLSGIGPHAA